MSIIITIKEMPVIDYIRRSDCGELTLFEDEGRSSLRVEKIMKMIELGCVHSLEKDKFRSNMTIVVRS